MKKKEIYFVFGVLVVFSILALSFFNFNFTGMVISEQKSGFSDFNSTNSIWENVFWFEENNSMILFEDNLFGEYISEIFDSEQDSLFINLTFEKNEPENTSLIFNVRSCNLIDCSDSEFQEAIDLNFLNLEGRYFQYKINFERDNESYSSPSISSSSLFYDFFEISLEINEPKGEKNSLVEVPLNFLSKGKNLSCYYEIFNSSQEIIYESNLFFAENCSDYSSLFDFTEEGDYNFFVYLDGNYLNGSSWSLEKNSSFSIFIPICGEENLDFCFNEEDCSEFGGYWYSDLCNEEELIEEESSESEEVVSETTENNQLETTTDSQDNVFVPEFLNLPETTEAVSSLSFSRTVNDFKIAPNSSREISLSVENIGGEGEFLLSCDISVSGNEEWILLDSQATNINPGEEIDFLFELVVPEDAIEEKYSFSLSVGCSGGEKISKDFFVDVEKEKFLFEVLDVRRIKKDSVRIIYSVEELIGEDQEIQANFSIFDPEIGEVANFSEIKEIESNSYKEFRFIFPINESLEGNFSLSAKINSEIYETNILETIVLGAPMGGFVIFEDLLYHGGLGIFFFILILLIVLFIFARVMKEKYRKKKVNKEEKLDKKEKPKQEKEKVEEKSKQEQEKKTTDKEEELI